ncbi:MAG: cereblon family protein [Candidatus Electrothrix sp. GW3-4]|uniref:cereblon family protein n=1 Tax=Candidatus Electrothrix sp. GW3-4 TaxID=3126740 RepID=UPI0030CF6C09
MPLRDPGTKNGDEHNLLDNTTSRSLNKDDEPIRCRTCYTPLTSKDQATSKQGRHEHAFFNPAGRAFEIHCFQDVPGCRVQGRPRAEFSWFTGYLLAICPLHELWDSFGMVFHRP